MSILFSQFFEKINQISPLEADFTKVLEGIALMPKMLYYNGKLPENVAGGGRPKVVAIVGARKNTAYGEEVAYKLAGEVAKRGGIVISGLAYGIDAVAHRGAVDAGGVSIGVLGTPIGEIYPRVHTALAQQMVEQGGAIISEYGPREEAGSGREARARFLMRNRLIAGLADAVVVVEAAVQSGSLNTAAHALEQGREVFAVPGNITNPMSQGCNRLIMQGAQPYTCPDDVLNLLFPPQPKTRQKRLIFGDNKEEVAVLSALDEGVRDGEKIAQVAAMDAATFNRTISMLEIKGAVRGLGANRWVAV